MKTIELVQGSPEWKAHRAKHFNASDAPAMMGVSKYKTRTDLLKEFATGITPDIDPATQRRFDAGHEAEAKARPIVEALINEELFPATGTETIDGLPLSASFDGISMLGDVIWENKLLNNSLKADLEAGGIDPHYWAQLEHQLLVSGAEKAYFTASDGTPEGTHGIWYESVPARRQQIINGWRQFGIDLENYQPTEAKPEAVADHIEALPALMIQVEGRVVATNLDVFKEKAGQFIAGIKTELVDDNDFATADKMVKFLGDGEKQLALVKQQAQAQASDIDAVFRAIDDISAQMREKRLALDKLVKAEKENRRAEIVNKAAGELQAYITKLNERIGGTYMPGNLCTAARFAEAIKGLKTLESMRDKVGTALANAKIEAGEIADRIEANKKAIDAVGKEYRSLFSHDLTLLLKDADDLKAIVHTRIAEHKAAIEARMAAERERIKLEEAAKVVPVVQAAIAQATDKHQPAKTPDQAVMDAEKDIREFLEAKVPASKRNAARAVLVEWEKWKALCKLQAAA